MSNGRMNGAKIEPQEFVTHYSSLITHFTLLGELAPINLFEFSLNKWIVLPGTYHGELGGFGRID